MQDNEIIGIRMKDNVVTNKIEEKVVVGVSDYFVDDENKEKEKKNIKREKDALLCKEKFELRN